MKMNVSEFAKLTGVSVRTLHYYDEIGLLKPDYVDGQNGYRFYGETALENMQEILFYRELDFSLQGIKKIISSPDYDKKEALKAQRKLLILKRERLDRIINQLNFAEKGENFMDFNAFSTEEINCYKDEVKKRWGRTDAYKEHLVKTADYTSQKWNDISKSLNKIISEFASLKDKGYSVECKEAEAMVKKLQEFITKTQYTCTDEILMSLGEMYVADERFKKNIDNAGKGTAEFIKGAITKHCKH